MIARQITHICLREVFILHKRSNVPIAKNVECVLHKYKVNRSLNKYPELGNSGLEM